MMPQPFLAGKLFYCRDWVFSKILNSLEDLRNRLEQPAICSSSRSQNGIILVGGPGAGKTAICAEIVSPSASQGKQWVLQKKLLAFHFCEANDAQSLCVSEFILHLVKQLSDSSLIQGYREKLEESKLQKGLEQISLDPDSAFREIILVPLLEISKPKHCCFILIDSIDEYNCNESSSRSLKTSCKSKTIVGLLANNSDMLPPWLLPIYTARTNQAFCKKVNKSSAFTSSFKKICLDDLRKSQVLRDVQQYILHRLDEDHTLKQHITKETAEMLNQLHIKSNGCFLYLEKVLDGISENFILLREIREIPGTLNGLYLWMCQRIFTKKQFSKVRCMLNVLLASNRPLSEDELYLTLEIWDNTMTREDFKRRMHVLRRVVVKSPEGYIVLFHHSFAEWLVDVKYCTQKYLCQVAEGHCVLSALFSHLAPHLSRAVELSYHLKNAVHPGLNKDLMPSLVLSTGVTTFQNCDPSDSLSEPIESITGDSNKQLSIIATVDTEESPTSETGACLFEGGGEALCESTEDSFLLINMNGEVCAEESPSLQREFLSRLDGRSCDTLITTANEGNVRMLEFLIAQGVQVSTYILPGSKNKDREAHHKRKVFGTLKVKIGIKVKYKIS